MTRVTSWWWAGVRGPQRGHSGCPDHPLLLAPPEVAEKLLFSPHIAGITATSFRRSYDMIAEDVHDAAEGRVPKRVVNRW